MGERTEVEGKTYHDASDVLNATKLYLTSSAAVHGLMVGICRRLMRYPERVRRSPYPKEWKVAEFSDVGRSVDMPVNQAEENGAPILPLTERIGGARVADARNPVTVNDQRLACPKPTAWVQDGHAAQDDALRRQIELRRRVGGEAKGTPERPWVKQVLMDSRLPACGSCRGPSQQG